MKRAGTGIAHRLNVLLLLCLAVPGTTNTSLSQVATMGHRSIVRAVAFSPDGKTLASASFDGEVILWDPLTGEALGQLPAQAAGVTRIAFSPDGQQLATAGMDYTVILWEVASGNETSVFRGHKRQVTCLAFAPDGKRTVSGDPLDFLVWAPGTGKVEHRLPIAAGVPSGNSCESVSFSQSGQEVLVSTWEKILRWDLRKNRAAELLTAKKEGRRFCVGARSPDGKHLAAVFWEFEETPEARLYNASSMQQRFTLPLEGPEIRYVEPTIAFAADSRTMAVAFDKMVAVCDVPRGRILHRPRVTATVLDVAFSPDGKWLAMASMDHSVTLWEVESGRLVRMLGRPVI